MSFDLSSVASAPDDVERIVLAEVTACEGKHSQAGNAMLNLRLTDVEKGWTLCFDRLMLAGKPFALTLTKAKLKALGVPLDRPLDPMELVGRRAWIAVRNGKPDEDGKVYRKVDINAKGSKFGYWPESNPPGSRASQPEPAKAPSSQSAPAQFEQPRATSPNFDDEIPF